MSDHLNLDILTPDGRVDLRIAEDARKPSGPVGPIPLIMVEGVQMPAALGEMGIRPRHIPFLTPIVPGVVRFRFDNVDRRMAVGAGFLEVSEDGTVTLLTERAVRSWEVKVDEVRKQLEIVADELKQHAHSSFEDAAALKLRARRDWLDAQLRASAS